MSQRYILRTVPAEQREQWDAFISGHANGHFLQSWGWGELKASAAWHPLRLALWDTEQQEIVAAAQVLRRSAPLFPLRIGHLAYVPKGPVLEWSHKASPLTQFWSMVPREDGAGGASTAPTFLAYLNAYLHRQGAIALQMELSQEVERKESNIVRACLEAQHFHPVRAIQPVRTILLDLTCDEDTLLTQMKEKCRYNIRLAGRKGVRVRAAWQVEDVHHWYRLLQTTSERDNFGIHTLNYYLRAWHIFVPRNQARLFLAEHNGQLLAGIFVGLLAKQAIYLYGASSNEQRQLMPNYLLQWEAIRWAKSEGATCYDFWGIPDTDGQDEAMAGVYRFKSGWGGRVVSFIGNYEHVYHPLAMHIARRFLP